MYVTGFFINLYKDDSLTIKPNSSKLKCVKLLLCYAQYCNKINSWSSLRYKTNLNVKIMKPINSLRKSILETKRRYIYTYSRIAIPIMINSSKSNI